MTPLAESWELRCHSDELSTIDGGEYYIWRKEGGFSLLDNNHINHFMIFLHMSLIKDRL